ncbi:MAG: hypothetical protein K8U03_26380 [Planctomycetia bacterium]|nr:hypothetical protein [Planctomycetia bacterium]
MNTSFLILLLLPAAAFFVSFVSARSSLGASISVLIGFGYFNGIIRANYISVFTTFMVDMAVLGVYLGALLNQTGLFRGIGKFPLASWVTALVLWPLIVSAVPQNDILVQFVAFRGTVWLLPIMLIATRLTDDDLRVIAITLAGLNIVALGAGLWCYVYGVESLYPVNAVTKIIYMSRDVAGGHLRIPSLFLSSAAYGGTMVGSLPYIVGRLFNTKNGTEKLWLIAGVFSALCGVALCAARAPVVAAGIMLLVAWLMSGLSLRVAIPIVLGLAAFATIVSSNERFQRLTSLSEKRVIVTRLQGSVNENFLDLLISYPFGAGMGSSAGTSIPYFLAHRAPKQIGLENEYSRILIDQGWIGLLLWLGFIAWVHFPIPHSIGSRSHIGIGITMMYSASVVTWCTAVIGSGTLSAIPGSILLLINMGVIVARRQQLAMSARRRPISRSLGARVPRMNPES